MPLFFDCVEAFLCIFEDFRRFLGGGFGCGFLRVLVGYKWLEMPRVFDNFRACRYSYFGYFELYFLS